jgi:steroid 5-alpha reductase family enzyme
MSETTVMPFYSIRNLYNAFLMHSVGFPIVLAGLHIIYDCPTEGLSPITFPLAESVTSATDNLGTIVCRIGLFHPILYVNIVVLFLVCGVFWFLSLIQKSTWLIDPYWTILPPMIAAFYHYHPFSQGDETRGTATILLTMLWSVRLTHSYFRRENFRFGAREDWRFEEMRKTNPNNFWWQSFFSAYVSQQVLLVGVTLPLWAVNFHHGPEFGAADMISLGCCMLALLISNVSDRQLRTFMLR